MKLDIKQRFVVVVFYIALILGLGYYFSGNLQFIIDPNNNIIDQPTNKQQEEAADMMTNSNNLLGLPVVSNSNLPIRMNVTINNNEPLMITHSSSSSSSIVDEVAKQDQMIEKEDKYMTMSFYFGYMAMSFNFTISIQK